MYGDRPPIQIERDLQGLAPIQEESMQAEPRPTNEEDDIGQMYSSKWISYHLSMAVETTNAPLPKQYRDVLKLSKEDQGSWMSAMKDEIKSLHERKVWKLVHLPKGHQPIKGRWVYVVKPDGRKKARFVTKGFTQIFGIDYEETFAPVTRFETFRIFMALAALHDWEIEALDVKTAYLFGELEEEIYMIQPEGFVVKGQEKKVCRLMKSLYGLKQSTLQWNKALHKSLLEMGFHRCKVDPGTYYKIIGEEIITLLIYVDDAFFMGSNKAQVLAHKAQFMKQWESRDLGQAKEYLGMRIIRDRKKRTISLDQTCYVEKVVKRFGQENCKPVSVPLPTGYNPRPHSTQNQSNATLRSRYQLVIGSLLYIMLGTRPDIAFAVIKMSQFSSNPTEKHLQKALYTMRYLSSSLDLCTMYSGTGNHNGLCAYSDTDWAGDVETSRSTTGYAICYDLSILFSSSLTPRYHLVVSPLLIILTVPSGRPTT
jgi:hypothetical protein